MKDTEAHMRPDNLVSDKQPPSPFAMVDVRHATTAGQLESCYPVIVHLRPQLTCVSEWCDRAEEMRTAGYRVLACWVHHRPQAVAGYRIAENLIHGRFLYVDDLVTSPEHRGQGLGAKLIEALTHIAEETQCARLVLDASARNIDAHRFYRDVGLQALIVGFVKSINGEMPVKD